MHRVVGVLALALCACLAAGCGGLSPRQAARIDAKLLFDDPHPRVLDVEIVRMLSGSREAWITMQGHFKGQVFVSPCSGAHCPAVRYVALNLLLPPRAGHFAGFMVPTPSMVTAVARAKHASPLFKIFSDLGPEAIRCDIPRGGPSPGTIVGACDTKTDPTPSNHVRRVEFIENWPIFRTNRYGGTWGHKYSARWIVTFSRDGGVVSIRVEGHPPQLSK
jgi:hypothetical protein